MQLVKNVPVSAGDARDVNSIPGWEDSLEQEMATTPVFLSGKFHAHRSLVGYSPWSHKELDMTEYAHTHTQTSVMVWGMFPFYIGFFLYLELDTITIRDLTGLYI